MQNASLLRLIEEAYLQGAVFDQPRLSMLTNITVKLIRSRLSPLLQKGVRYLNWGKAENTGMGISSFLF